MKNEFDWRLGLERVSMAIESLKPKLPPSIIVAGTNGKGSTSFFLSAALLSQGLKVGTFMSPHVRDYAERFLINLKAADSQKIKEVRRELKGIFEKFNLSYFEEAFITAVYLFQDLDAVVYEVGLGGRLDATNAISHKLAVITTISKDHTDILGQTLREIASEKLSVIKGDIPVVLGKVPEFVANMAFMLTDRVFSLGKDFYVKDVKISPNGTSFTYQGKEFFIKNVGIHQAINAAVALKAAEVYLNGIDLHRAFLKFKEVKLPYRYEIVRDKPILVLDVAHNEEGIDAFVRTSEALVFFFDRIVFSALKDKDMTKMLKKLKKISKDVAVVPLNNERGYTLSELKRMFGEKAQPLSRKLFEGVNAAVVGSFYLISEFFKLF